MIVDTRKSTSVPDRTGAEIARQTVGRCPVLGRQKSSREGKLAVPSQKKNETEDLRANELVKKKGPKGFSGGRETA